MDRVPGLWLSISATTRPPRPGEREGEHYFFITQDDFDRLIANDGLLEWAEVHGNRYGTPRAAVDAQTETGLTVILEIDPQGAMQVKQRDPDAVLVFIMPPDLEELQRRLRGRGSETEEQMNRRLDAARQELQFAGTYDYVVINDDVRRASDELAALITRLAAHESEPDRN